jgi:hypothetical protein
MNLSSFPLRRLSKEADRRREAPAAAIGFSSSTGSDNFFMSSPDATAATATAAAADEVGGASAVAFVTACWRASLTFSKNVNSLIGVF